MLDVISKFKLVTIDTLYKSMTTETLMELLQISSIQESLKHIKVGKIDVFDCPNILSLLSKFKKLKYISISWNSDYNNDSQECKDNIKKIREEIKILNSDIIIDLDCNISEESEDSFHSSD